MEEHPHWKNVRSSAAPIQEGWPTTWSVLTDAGSLDRIVSDDSDMALIDCVSYDNDIMEELENNYDRERIGRMLDMLPWEEASLIRDFYGIDRTERITFNEMGKRQGVSRERMRQKFNRAIMKLRTIYSKQTRGGLSGEV